MTLPVRKKLRLQNYDYSKQGAYFVTICTEKKLKILCDIIPPEREDMLPVIHYTALGLKVDQILKKIPGMDKYVIMPNHVHFILINDRQIDISTTVRIFKTNVTRALKQNIWQKSYYDHILRDDSDYQIRWNYIDTNPIRWTSDDYYV